MGALIRWFLKNPVAVNLLMVSLLAIGATAMTSVTVRTFPEIATSRISVTVAYPGASPSDIAQSILTPIEQRLEGLEGVRELQSTAAQDVGTVVAELTSGADPRLVKDDIETEVARITTFPDGAESPRIAEVEPEELAVELVLYGAVARETLKDLAFRVRDELTSLEGVSQVSLAGVPADQIDIEVRRETLRSYGLGLLDLAGRLSSQNVDLSSGQLDTGTSTVQVRTLGEAQSAEEFRDTELFSDENGATVQLSDIATIRETLAESGIRATVSGEPAVFVSVNRAASEQVLGVSSAVLTYLEEELQPSLPDSIRAEVWRNEGAVLQGRIDLLTKNGALGAMLILTVLMLVLDLRVAAWVAAGVVVAFIGAFAPMLFLGPTINQLSLFGFILALGIVVDDAIVVGEQTFSELESGSEDDAAERAITKVWRPIMFAVSTTVLAFVPLLFLPGSSGSFIGPVAAVVIYVLVVSLVECFFILPGHLSHVKLKRPRKLSPRRLTEPLRKRLNGGFDRFANGPLRKVVRVSIRHPIFVIAACLAIGIASVGVINGGLVRFVFFPAIEGNFVNAELRFPEGTSDQETVRRANRFVEAAQAAADELGEETLLQNVAVRVGFAGSGGDPSAASGTQTGSTATIEAKLLAANQRETAAAAFESAWRKAVGDVAGAQEVLFSSSVVGVGAAILIEISADSEETRFAATERLRQALSERDGVVDIRDDRFSAAREIAIEPTAAARAYGVSVEQLAQNVRAALYGAQIDQFAREREEVDIRLRLVEEQRDSVADLLALRIPAPATSEERGDLIPLTVLADLNYQSAPVEISRINGRTITTLTADVDNAVTTGGAETSWLMNNVAPQLLKDYPDLVVETGGEQEEAGRFGSNLAYNFSLALFGIYAVLALAFGSYLLPIVVLLVIPFGVIGAILGHLLLGLNLTLLSLFGIIGLAGVVVNGSLLIVTFMQQQEADGAEPADAIEEAAIARFRPIVLTTLTTFLGITPLILETSVQAQFLIPTAVSLGFGVLFAALLQMVLVPANASLAERVRHRRRKRNERARA